MTNPTNEGQNIKKQSHPIKSIKAGITTTNKQVLQLNIGYLGELVNFYTKPYQEINLPTSKLMPTNAPKLDLIPFYQ